ncbi:helix-turn-helix domain-containing protein [Pseudomonas japonica]|uniref:helix-turn-helix domain-containing protein n=2 Tax=Pseudomonas japonica TaxID=256466 RepID=UPI000A034E5F
MTITGEDKMVENVVNSTCVLPKTSIRAEQGSLQKLAKMNLENPRAASLMLILMARMNSKQALSISQSDLASLCKCSLNTVKRAISYLVERGWVRTESGIVGGALTYFVSPAVARPGKVRSTG